MPGGSQREQFDVVERHQLPGIGDPRPQFERALGQAGGLTVGVDVTRGERGPNGRAQRGGLVAPGRVVVGDRGRELDPPLGAV